ncbi:MAG: FAD-binding protein [Proteobacteria bacterium]|nr:FAD-binding protein [Pseudomonadota bacterium]
MKLGAALYGSAILPISESEGDPVAASPLGIRPTPTLGSHTRTKRDRLVRTLGLAGADRVIIVPVPVFDGPAIWARHGPALHSVCEHVEPRAVLMAATHTGRDIAPRLAARLGAAFVAEPSVEYGPQGRIILAREIHGPAIIHRLSLEAVTGCAVVTLTPGSYRSARGSDKIRSVLFDPPEQSNNGIEYLDSAADPGADLEHARIVAVAGGGCDQSGYALVGKLADALGGQLAATPTLAARGIAPPDRVIGVGARQVAPELYLVCAASGSREHLDAVARDATIIAINSDCEAPVFHEANYGIVDTIERAIPAFIDALPAARTSDAAP